MTATAAVSEDRDERVAIYTRGDWFRLAAHMTCAVGALAAGALVLANADPTIAILSLKGCALWSGSSIVKDGILNLLSSYAVKKDLPIVQNWQVKEEVQGMCHKMRIRVVDVRQNDGLESAAAPNGDLILGSIYARDKYPRVRRSASAHELGHIAAKHHLVGDIHLKTTRFGLLSSLGTIAITSINPWFYVPLAVAISCVVSKIANNVLKQGQENQSDGISARVNRDPAGMIEDIVYIVRRRVTIT